jgi:hypothetical protein
MQGKILLLFVSKTTLFETKLQFMKKSLIINFLCCFTFSLSISGQVNEARKIDEFGVLSCKELVARTIKYENELMRNPLNNNKPKFDNVGYILVYEGKINGINPKRKDSDTYVTELGSILRRNRGFLPPFNITFINAAYRENFTFEFWIGKENSKPPELTPTLKEISFRKGKPNKPRNCLKNAPFRDTQNRLRFVS